MYIANVGKTMDVLIYWTRGAAFFRWTPHLQSCAENSIERLRFCFVSFLFEGGSDAPLAQIFPNSSCGDLSCHDPAFVVSQLRFSAQWRRVLRFRVRQSAGALLA